MELIKIIWDFRGENNFPIAKHHAIHLKEFCLKEKLDFKEIRFSEISEMSRIIWKLLNK